MELKAEYDSTKNSGFFTVEVILLSNVSWKISRRVQKLKLLMKY